jgi:hypothetical protein
MLALLVSAMLLLATTPTHAEISKLTLHRRTCASVTAYVNYDGFAEGQSPYYVAFGVDTNNNGIFGEPGEALTYSRIKGNVGSSLQVAARVRFTPVREGTRISVIAYKVDDKGNQLWPQLGPVSYDCTQRPALDALPAESGQPESSPAVVAAITSPSVQVYAEASVKSQVIGGLGQGQRVVVVALNERGDWAQIEVNGVQGWILWRTNAYLFGAWKNLPRVPNYEG